MNDFNLPTRRQALLLGTAGLAALGRPAWAAAYPDKAVRLINPFAAGGSIDAIARLVAVKMSSQLGNQIFVDSVAGAGGTIGADRAAHSTPDGYTLVVSNVASNAIAMGLYSKLPYDGLADFAHVGMFGTLPNVLVVKEDFSARTLREFIALAKAQPGKLTFSSAGNGSTPHLSGEMFKAQAGIQALHVPYKGGGPALQAVLAGEVSFLFDNYTTSIASVKAGKLRVLGLTSGARLPFAPELPTIREQGLPNFVAETWHGISAPRGTPAAIVQQLSAALLHATADKEVSDRLAELGVTPSRFTSAQYKAFIAAEIRKWGEVIRTSGAKVD